MRLVTDYIKDVSLGAWCFDWKFKTTTIETTMN